MQEYTESLTEAVGHDWFPRNLNSLRTSIQETVAAVLARTDTKTDPLLDAPNLQSLRGQYRWVLLPALMEKHIGAGRYPGIAGRYVDLGGVSVYELEGENTTMTICHLRHDDDVPRESTYRKEKRRSNKVAQARFGFDLSASNKVNLTLVYGVKDEAPFGYLRAYYDEDNRSYYHRVSSNLMVLPALLDDTETEQVPDPQVELGLRLNPARFYKA